MSEHAPQRHSSEHTVEQIERITTQLGNLITGTEADKDLLAVNTGPYEHTIISTPKGRAEYLAGHRTQLTKRHQEWGFGQYDEGAENRQVKISVDSQGRLNSVYEKSRISGKGDDLKVIRDEPAHLDIDQTRKAAAKIFMKTRKGIEDKKVATSEVDDFISQ